MALLEKKANFWWSGEASDLRDLYMKRVRQLISEKVAAILAADGNRDTVSEEDMDQVFRQVEDELKGER